MAMKEDMPPGEQSVKTIMNAFGDVFDCVDIYKQPAFDHPLLKNHTIQMKPTGLPQGIAEFGTSEGVSSQPHLEDKCPIGFIPIMRNPKNHSMTMEPTSNFRPADILNIHLLDNKIAGHTSVADVRLLEGEYYGSIAEINTYALPQISINQYSLSASWVISDGAGLGPRDQTNVILTGWMVNPSLFGDAQTRLFTYWTGDGYHNKSCFNHLCPGFVQVNPAVPLGGVLPVSVYNGAQYVTKILIFRDPKTGNWWMVMGENLDLYVGYWPNSIFTTLAKHANVLMWGGTGYTSHGEKSPPMGSGHWPEEGYGKACFFDSVGQIIRGNMYGEIPEDKVSYYQSPCYRIGYFQKKEAGRYFQFGGPGGC